MREREISVMKYVNKAKDVALLKPKNLQDIYIYIYIIKRRPMSWANKILLLNSL